MFRRGVEIKEIIEDEDREIVLRCQRGEVDAFSILVERHQKKMLNVAYRMTGDYEEACDCVQEAFLAAYRGIEKFRKEARFSTWLYGIVVNQTKNRLRQLRNRQNHEGTVTEHPLCGEISRNDGERTGTAESAADCWERKELEARVQACIGDLDEDYREVLVLKDIQNLSYEEIRETLHIPAGTVKSRLFRARLALKDCLVRVLGDAR